MHSASTRSSHFHVQLLLLFANILLLVPARAQQPPAERSAQLSAPFETIKNSKEFNAVRFGPGNTFSIVETPPDFRQSEFAISRDGRLLAMGFASGRIELWDIQDGTELWTVNRNELMAFHTTNWELIGHGPLKSPPMGTSRPVVRTGVTRDGRQTVAVPSAQRLVIYTEPEMSGDYVTDQQTNAAAFAPSTNTYVNLAGKITLLNGEGHSLCKKSYKGRVGEALSDDGQWLALSQFNSVDLWRMEDLVRDCVVGR
jgi:hypothetical protein